LCAAQLARRVPKVAKIVKHHIAEFCEVARMLTDSLGVRSSVALCRVSDGQYGFELEQTLVCEPVPHALLESSSIDRALASMGEFADLVSPCFVGHSAGVAMLASNAARRCNLDESMRHA
jgi:hypothetical protein